MPKNLVRIQKAKKRRRQSGPVLSGTGPVSASRIVVQMYQKHTRLMWLALYVEEDHEQASPRVRYYYFCLYRLGLLRGL